MFEHLARNLKSFGKYVLYPMKLGCEVRGVDLNEECNPEVIKKILQDVTKHRLLIFRKQGNIGGRRQVEISKWFGDIDSTFYKHPKSPHRDIFRVSNDKNEGCTGVGRSGWHIDGSFQYAPFSYSLYHIVKVPENGNTIFAPLTELIEGLSTYKREKWERLWMISDRQKGPIHPLIYNHPVTGKKVLCLHLGMTKGYIWDKDTPDERLASDREFEDITKDINEEFEKDDKKIQYSHKWEAGDLIITDNLSVAHEAAPEAQYAPNKVGLRVIHRTTIKGHGFPKKLD